MNASNDLDLSVSDSPIRRHYAEETVTFGTEILLQHEAKVFEQALKKNCLKKSDLGIPSHLINKYCFIKNP